MPNRRRGLVQHAHTPLEALTPRRPTILASAPPPKFAPAPKHIFIARRRRRQEVLVVVHAVLRLHFLLTTRHLFPLLHLPTPPPAAPPPSPPPRTPPPTPTPTPITAITAPIPLSHIQRPSNKPRRQPEHLRPHFLRPRHHPKPDAHLGREPRGRCHDGGGRRRRRR